IELIPGKKLNKKIRILYIITGLTAGGAELHLSKIINNLSFSEFEKIVCSLTSTYDILPLIKNNTKSVYILDARKKRDLIKIILQVRKIIKITNPNIVHCVMFHSNIIGRIAALLNILIFKRKMFISVQGRLKLGWTGLIENIFDKTITRFIYSNSSKIICVSNPLKRRLRKFKIKNQKLMIIPNGVDVDKFSLERKGTCLDKYLKNTIDYKKVIFVGRLDLQKGVEYLIRAIPNVITHFTNVHFFILGNGRIENNLKNLTKSLAIEKYTTFINMVPLEDMPKFYSSADIFCLPSIHEGFPLSLLEALSMGLIIVASNTGGIPEAIIENENGYLFKPKNIQQLSLKLLKALNLSYDEIVQIQKNNIQRAYRTYSWEKIVDEIIKIYIESN
ncbi:unnamed protein product, partial [marine sediment metagenome]